MCLMVVFAGKFLSERKMQLLRGQQELKLTRSWRPALHQDFSGNCSHAHSGSDLGVLQLISRGGNSLTGLGRKFASHLL